ncbi:hypothetical protein Hanom_Chr13g01239361 [Helianthus anomalus]
MMVVVEGGLLQNRLQRKCVFLGVCGLLRHRFWMMVVVEGGLQREEVEIGSG